MHKALSALAVLASGACTSVNEAMTFGDDPLTGQRFMVTREQEKLMSVAKDRIEKAVTIVYQREKMNLPGTDFNATYMPTAGQGVEVKLEFLSERTFFAPGVYSVPINTNVKQERELATFGGLTANGINALKATCVEKRWRCEVKVTYSAGADGLPLRPGAVRYAGDLGGSIIVPANEARLNGAPRSFSIAPLQEISNAELALLRAVSLRNFVRSLLTPGAPLTESYEIVTSATPGRSHRFAQVRIRIVPEGPADPSPLAMR